jgi:adenosylcobinamide-GDP ribazoletransferase
MSLAMLTAFRTLTILPIPGKDTENYATSLMWFPLVGAILGGILLLIHYMIIGILNHISSGVEALVLVTLNAVLTGGMHLDGLADVADALGCRQDREKMFSVMKDPRIGAFGTIALILALLGQWIAITQLIEQNLMSTLVVAFHYPGLLLWI